MTAVALGPTLTLVLWLAPAQMDPYADRPRSIIAPSLPQLTREEEKALDELLDRFMRADVGQLTGNEATQAIRDFQALGMEAVPALIRGLNRAATYKHSCPILQLTGKLTKLLAKSHDGLLLDFARDNLGAGVPDNNPYQGRFRQMRVELAMRMNALARENPMAGRLVTPTPTPMPQSLGGRDPKQLPPRELAGLAKTESGETLKVILRELETRRGPEVFAGLGAAAANTTSDIRMLSRDLLLRHLGRLSLAEVVAQLENGEVEVRRAAVDVVLEKHPGALAKLIDRVADKDEGIRQQVRAALVREAKPVDFGPDPNESEAEIRKARDRWRTWWDLNRR
jgi:hypothetical protein